jgi:hypothetical protein
MITASDLTTLAEKYYDPATEEMKDSAPGPIQRAITGNHDTKACKVYRCGLCRSLGGVDAKRGLKP